MAPPLCRHVCDLIVSRRRSGTRAQQRRQARDQELKEQNSAYQQSLEADRSKEEARLRDEMAEKEAAKASAEQERSAEERLESLRAAVPPEPVSGDVSVPPAV